MLCDSNYLEQSDSETGRRMVNVGAGRNGQFFKWVEFQFSNRDKVLEMVALHSEGT